MTNIEFGQYVKALIDAGYTLNTSPGGSHAYEWQRSAPIGTYDPFYVGCIEALAPGADYDMARMILGLD